MGKAVDHSSLMFIRDFAMAGLESFQRDQKGTTDWTGSEDRPEERADVPLLSDLTSKHRTSCKAIDLHKTPWV